MYLARTTIPKKRQTHKGLIKVYGIGAKTSEKLCNSLGLLKEVRVRQLRRTHRRLLKTEFSEFFRPIGADLKNLEKTRCQRLINIQSYRGRRHKFGYPVRGQRTHTNARTQKRLHRRWFIKQHEKPKHKPFQKTNTVLKSKKPKTVSKSKSQDKNKKAVPKAGKYKIT